jgi:RNA polymerase sigma factor (sigma-70 family)
MSIDLAAAREQFLGLVAEVRPDLHRYASRLVGSAIDGEDVVQDVLAKAFYLLSQSPELPPLRPWLYRVAKNAAIDFLRRHERTRRDPLPEDDVMASDDYARDPEVMRAALTTFMLLPTTQRSAVIMKDVLDESLEDIALHLETTVAAVKSLLVRGRATLHAHAASDEATQRASAGAATASAEQRELVRRYVALFNARDWDGARALLVDECRLDLVSKSQRQGQAVGMYFGRYAQETGLSFQAGTCEGRSAVGVFRDGALAYIVLIAGHDGQIASIRDFRYVPYLARELEFVPD